jgi:predicted CXXCH cytochrome family protein
MRPALRIIAPVALLVGAAVVLAAQEQDGAGQPPKTAPAAKPAQAPAVADDDNSCIQCHATLTDEDQKRLLVTAQDLAADVHWQKGMRCQDCHGGDPTVLEIKAHQGKDDFKTVKTPADIPEFCGKCHADIGFMRHYKPSPRTDQLAEYWTSGHGRQLKEKGDLKVATCVSCHGKAHGSGADRAKHGILAVGDLDSPVYRTKLAKTCARCHADKELMAGREYHGRPLGHDQYAKWRDSVHGKALLDKGDLSAPTCNNCHGNHGAVPPQVDSVANACGTCHGKVAKLFEGTQMRHKFEKEGLPGCATCHNAHDIVHPTDDMLGMERGAVCLQCHAETERKAKGGTLAGAEDAAKLRKSLEQLKREIELADTTLSEAERLGMEVSSPRFELRKATDALTNARSLIHTFKVSTVETALGEGSKVVVEVQQRADAALQEHDNRRIWLAATLAPILLVIVILLAYIRRMPAPAE